MATPTLTGQRRACAVLAAILATPGLAEATWTVWGERVASGRMEIHGQIAAGSAGDVNAAIDAYALAFGLRFDPERSMSGSDYCEAFTEIATSGVIDGVKVKVWGAAR